MDSDYKFVLIEKSEYDKWDSFVDESPQGTIFHKSLWLEVSGEKLRIFGCYHDLGDLIAGFTCYEYKLYGLFKHLTQGNNSPYYGNLYTKSEGKYLTKLSRNRAISYEIAKTVKSYCHIANIVMSPYEMEDIMAFIWAGFTTNVNYTYVLDIKDTDLVWKNMDVDCRNSIRKAIKDGIFIDTECDFDKVLNLAKKTLLRQNHTPSDWIKKSPEYNRIMSERTQCKSFIAKNKDNTPLAVVYIIWDNKRCYYVMGGYDHKNRHHGASSLALWTAIEYARKEINLYEFDFEGTMLKSVEPFFREFGAKLTPYYTVSWVDHRLKPFFTLKRLIRETYGMIMSNK
jgi:hypothetical protein